MLKKVFSSQISPPCRAVQLVLESLKLKDFKTEELDILSKQYLNSELVKINPQHTVPTLVDGDHVVWDSHAIALYLVSKYGTAGNLYPQDAEKRSKVDQRLHFDTGVLYPTLCGAIKPILLRRRCRITKTDRIGFFKSYKILNTFLEGSKWICGDDMTVADHCCLATASTMDFVFLASRENFPNLRRYLDMCEYEMPHFEGINQTGIDLMSQILQENAITLSGRTFK